MLAEYHHVPLPSLELLPCLWAPEQVRLCGSEQKTSWGCWIDAFLSHASLHQRRFQIKFRVFKDLCNCRLVDFFTTAAIHPLESVLFPSSYFSIHLSHDLSNNKYKKLGGEEILVALQKEPETQISPVSLQLPFLHMLCKPLWMNPVIAGSGLIQTWCSYCFHSIKILFLVLGRKNSRCDRYSICHLGRTYSQCQCLLGPL